MKHLISHPVIAVQWLKRHLSPQPPSRTLNPYAPSRPAALCVVALMALQLGRFFLAFDVKPLICPHHAGMDMGMAMNMAPSGSSHQGHQMMMAPSSGAQPADGAPVCRCCCRYSWESLMTIVVLDVPSDSVNAPLFEGARTVAFTAAVSHPENDLSPPFQPPRV